MTQLLCEKKINENTFILLQTNNKIDIDRSEIILELGYKDSAPPEGINDLISGILLKIPDMIQISAGFKILPVKLVEQNGIIINNVFFKTDKIIAAQLKNSEQAVIFVSTIGPHMEQWTDKLVKEGDPALSYIVDITASVLVENTASLLHNHVEEFFNKKGLTATNRFSPGYCGWNVKEQHKLFNLIPKNFCGISLNKSAFMIPRKSISGIIGIGSKVTKTEYPCKRCSETNCLYRLSHTRKVEINKNFS